MDTEQYSTNTRAFLGKGSYGSVFKGRDKLNNIPVAIKKIEDADHLNKSTMHEIESLMVVDHENILKLYDTFLHEDSWWLVLELCDQNLAKFLKESKPNLETKLSIMSQSALGISYLHNLKKPIVHRDLKLENILLKSTSDGQKIVKICDFGFSKIISSVDQPLASDIGTYMFRAPELSHKIDGKFQYTATIDTFALGLVFKIVLDYGLEGESLEPQIGKGGRHQYLNWISRNHFTCYKLDFSKM